MNGASLYWSDPRVHYVEGFRLDRFAAAEWVFDRCVGSIGLCWMRGSSGSGPAPDSGG